MGRDQVDALSRDVAAAKQALREWAMPRADGAPGRLQSSGAWGLVAAAFTAGLLLTRGGKRAGSALAAAFSPAIARAATPGLMQMLDRWLAGAPSR